MLAKYFDSRFNIFNIFLLFPLFQLFQRKMGPGGVSGAVYRQSPAVVVVGFLHYVVLPFAMVGGDEAYPGSIPGYNGSRPRRVEQLLPLGGSTSLLRGMLGPTF